MAGHGLSAFDAAAILIRLAATLGIRIATLVVALFAAISQGATKAT